MVFDLIHSLFNTPYVPPSYFLRFLITQFSHLPLPPKDSYHGKTIIITGASAGLGLEAARHYVHHLGAARVIIACRNTESGETAKASIGSDKVEVWPLDLCSFESVAAFRDRAERELERLDVLLLNAGVAMRDVQMAGGYEMTITTNVISTFLLAVMLLPLLKKTVREKNVDVDVTVVASEAHLFTSFQERFQPKIFESFRQDGKFIWKDRYGTSKLLDVMLANELANRLGDEAGVIVNSVNPGLCRTGLFRHLNFIIQGLLVIFMFLFARTTEQGSRTLILAADGGRRFHGKYSDSGKVIEPSSFVLSDEGKRTQKRAWGELMDIFEGIESGVTGNI
ncbi:putative Dehydrogenase/reductase [Podospora australis]|uniref:Dehydrogenase/reductase n=1 Tax=Podospora australis TaxID=1536484 RepID=A0AAN6X396_9PEZI|nr:putative Dehydrogenase/reductase [Podospora australis]